MKIYTVLIFLFLLSSVVGILEGTTSKENVLLSAWLFLPILYLFYAHPISRFNTASFYSYFKISEKILLIVDFIGLIVWISTNFGVDMMGAAYGSHYEAVHGLAMVNVMYALYYIALIRKKEFKKRHLTKFIIIVLSFIFCDYGLGVLIIASTVTILLLLERKFKYLLLLAILSISSTFIFISDLFSYNRENIDSAIYDQDNARKVIMYYNSVNLLAKEPEIAIFGTGPGGYNSRTTALLSGNNSNIFTDFLGVHQPKYYKEDIWPLWNNLLVSFDDHTDGTRNKPYSSFVAMVAEYGFIFSLIIIYTVFKRIKSIQKKKSKFVLDYYILYLDIFMFIACLVHEWMVCTEFIVYLLLRFFASKQIKINEKKANISIR